MRRRTLNVWFVVLALAFVASAQYLHAEKGREQSGLQMDGSWRFHAGDDPAWADPNFDDSQWPLAPKAAWTIPRPAPSTVTGWYRLHFMLPDSSEPLSLYLPPLPTSYQLFANGREFSQFGSPAATLTKSPVPQLFRIPTDISHSRDLVLSIRVQYQPHLAWYAGLPGFHGTPMVGPASQTLERFYFDDLATIHQQVSSFFVVFLCLQLAVLSSSFYLLRRSDRFYLWVAIYASASAVFFGLLATMPLFSWPILPTGLLFGGLNFVFAISEFQIVANLLNTESVAGADRRNYPWLLVMVAAVFIGGIDEMLVVDGGRSGLWNDIHSVLFLAVPISIFWLIRTSASNDNDRFRAWIVFGVLTLVLAYFNVLGLVSKLPFLSGSGKDSLHASFRSLSVSPFPVGFWELSEMLILTVLFVITMERFSKKMREAKRVQSEIEADELTQAQLSR